MTPSCSRTVSITFVAFLLVYSFYVASPIDATQFTHLTYAQINYQIKTLSQQYPNLLRVYSAQDRFSLPHVGNCSELVNESSSERSVPCTIYVVEMTNFDTLGSDPERPEWLVSGELHGDEVVGPPSVLAFIQFMVSHYDTNSFAHRMIDTRLTTLVPTTNAIGYFLNQRTEVQTLDDASQPLSIDPNRDFAFNQDPKKCMQTVAARTLNELFRVHLFRVTITFHAGTNALGYEWGDMSHCEGPKCKPSPDTHVMHALAQRMSSNAGPAGAHEDPYPIGDMGKLVYPVNGGLEDWAYGASWTDQAIVCRPETLGGYPASKTAIERNTKRCVTYLVETSNAKRPSALTLGSSDDIDVKGAEGDGHIPRNVRLLFSVIDAIEPYVILNDLSISNDLEPHASWSVSGAFLVDATLLQWSTLNGSNYGLSEADNGTAGVSIAGGLGKNFLSLLPTQFLNISTPLYYRVAAVVDQHLTTQPRDSDPNTSPQSHLMGSRSSTKWAFNVGDRYVRGRRVFYSETMMVRELESGKYSQSLVKDAVWEDTFVEGHLFAISDDRLFETLMSGKHGNELEPTVTGASNRHILFFSTLVGICGIIMVTVIIFLMIRRRRWKKDRPGKLRAPFALEEDQEERIALAAESMA